MHQLTNADAAALLVATHDLPYICFSASTLSRLSLSWYLKYALSNGWKYAGQGPGDRGGAGV